MSTATKTWDKKTIYHSELVRASQGGLAVMFTGKPRDSKYAGKPAFVGFKVYGDESDYTLNIENDDIRKTLEGTPDRVWLVVRADGTRDMAWLHIEDAQGNPVLPGVTADEIAQPPKPPAAHKSVQPTAPAGPPPNEWAEEAAPAPVDNGPRTVLADRYYLALCAADDAVQRFAREHGGAQPSDSVRNIATTLFIQASGR